MIPLPSRQAHPGGSGVGNLYVLPRVHPAGKRAFLPPNQARGVPRIAPMPVPVTLFRSCMA
jgi:hypothetical protein